MPSVRASAPSTLSVNRPPASPAVSWPSSIRKQPSRLVPTTVPASASTSRLYQSRWMYRPRSTPAMRSSSLASPGVMIRLAASGAGEDSRAMCACPVETPPVAPARGQVADRAADPAGRDQLHPPLGRALEVERERQPGRGQRVVGDGDRGRGQLGAGAGGGQADARLDGRGGEAEVGQEADQLAGGQPAEHHVVHAVRHRHRGPGADGLADGQRGPLVHVQAARRPGPGRRRRRRPGRPGRSARSPPRWRPRGRAGPALVTTASSVTAAVSTPAAVPPAARAASMIRPAWALRAPSSQAAVASCQSPAICRAGAGPATPYGGRRAGQAVPAPGQLGGLRPPRPRPGPGR